MAIKLQLRIRASLIYRHYLHILPQLHWHTLFSIGQFCDSGCEARFTKEKAFITKDNKILIEGERDYNGLWALYLHKTQTANYFHTDTTLKESINYLHASCHSPMKST
jgi:hypothetical protein